MKGECCSLATRVLLCILAFSVWASSLLGLVHRTVHPSQSHAPAVAVVDGTSNALTSPKHGSTSFLHALIGKHTSADCRLYDQLSGWHVPLDVPLLLLPIALPTATFAWLTGQALLRWATLFDARGPPSTR